MAIVRQNADERSHACSVPLEGWPLWPLPVASAPQGSGVAWCLNYLCPLQTLGPA